MLSNYYCQQKYNIKKSIHQFNIQSSIVNLYFSKFVCKLFPLPNTRWGWGRWWRWPLRWRRPGQGQGSSDTWRPSAPPPPRGAQWRSSGQRWCQRCQTRSGWGNECPVIGTDLVLVNPSEWLCPLLVTKFGSMVRVIHKAASCFCFFRLSRLYKQASSAAFHLSFDLFIAWTQNLEKWTSKTFIFCQVKSVFSVCEEGICILNKWILGIFMDLCV